MIDPVAAVGVVAAAADFVSATRGYAESARILSESSVSAETRQTALAALSAAMESLADMTDLVVSGRLVDLDDACDCTAGAGGEDQ